MCGRYALTTPADVLAELFRLSVEAVSAPDLSGPQGPLRPRFNIAPTQDAPVVRVAGTQRRLSMLLVGLFAGFALLLTVIGIYGVVSYSVNQRTHEMGIRSALGATPGEILRLVVGEGLRLAVFGVAIGLVVSLGLARFINSLLYGINANDVVTYVYVALLLITITVLASYVPARRATRVDPMLALRTE